VRDTLNPSPKLWAGACGSHDCESLGLALQNICKRISTPAVISYRLHYLRQTVLSLRIGFDGERRAGFVQSRIQSSNLQLRRFILAPQSADVVGEPGISDFQSNFA